jgi:hypothetical protein
VAERQKLKAGLGGAEPGGHLEIQGLSPDIDNIKLGGVYSD